MVLYIFLNLTTNNQCPFLDLSFGKVFNVYFIFCEEFTGLF